MWTAALEDHDMISLFLYEDAIGPLTIEQKKKKTSKKTQQTDYSFWTTSDWSMYFYICSVFAEEQVEDSNACVWIIQLQYISILLFLSL